MIIAFDIGNTLTKIALCKQGKILENIKVKTDPERLGDDYYHIIKTFYPNIGSISKVLISSVVPKTTKNLKGFSRKYSKKEPFIVKPGVKTGIFIKADNPNEVGSDIICNAVWGCKNYKKGLIIDLGTANKYIYFNNNKFLGVAFTVGIDLSLMALTNGTALIPEISFEVPSKVLGNNTVSATQGGAFFSLRCEILGMIEKIKEEVEEPDLPVIFTGGVFSYIKDIIDIKYDYVKDLTTLGLLMVYDKNKGREK